MRLTNTSIASLEIPAGKSQALFFDDEVKGFGIRLSSGGARQWFVQYRNQDGVKKRETLGLAGLLSATDARRAAAEKISRAKLGADPHAERKQAKARAAVTIGSLVDGYLEERSKEISASYMGDLKRYMTVTLKPLHQVPLQDLTRAEVKAWLGTVPGTSAANQARAALSKFYAWAMASGLANSNPVAGTAKPAPNAERERVLRAPELKAVWLACAGDDDFSQIVRLLILTGQRREEVAGMRWSEITFETGIWAMPGSRTKNGLPHEIPLPPVALEVLRSRQDDCWEDRDFVFGRRGTGFSGFSKAKAALGERCPLREPWVLHDLRRTFATEIGRLGVPPHVVEAILNHISGTKAGVAGIYNRALYEAEKRSALQLWADYVTAFEPGVQLAPADAVAAG